MRHPADGTLRRLVDEPVGVADADREHAATCPVCLSTVAAVQRDMALAAAVLSSGVTAGPALASDLDVDAGWRRLSWALALEGRGRAPVTVPASRWRMAVRSPLVAAVGVVVLLAGAGAAAAADWLQIFRTERVAAVSVTEADLVALPDLSGYGELNVTSQPSVRDVAGATAATAATGLPVPVVRDLPRGVGGEPTYQVGGQASAVFTFSAARTAQTAAAAGRTAPPPPPGLDGSRFRLVAGPGLAAVWPEHHGVPALVVARAAAPTVYSSGVPFATARDYLLSLPGLPADLASQLRAFAGDGTTLPLPVPVEQMTSATVDVGGTTATLLTARDGSSAGVVWVDGGAVLAVAGTLSGDEVLSVAREVRWSR
jgi:hypothetical protein